MDTIQRALASLFISVSLAGAAAAQGARPAGQADPTVTASATENGVRFVALGPVKQMRVEVLGADGAPLSDSGFRPGSVYDWAHAGGGAPPLADGDYQFVVTVMDVAGRLSLKRYAVVVAGGAAALKVGETEPERAAAAADAQGAESPAMALTAHDGREGQLVTTAGDLSFRGGDFFTGRDKELMRLSSDGTLTVSGALLARGGIRFSDGTILESAHGLNRAGASDKGAKAGAAGARAPDASPSAAINRLARFSTTSGDITDSNFSDVNGTLGVGTDAPDLNYKLDVRGHVVLGNTRKISLVADFPGNGEIAAGGFFGSLGRNGLSFAASTDFGNAGAQVKLVYYNGGAWLSALEFANTSGGLRSNLLLMKNGGNVGVGTDAPQHRLDVAGDINTPTQYNLGGQRVLGAPGTNNLFAGAGAGASNTSSEANAFFGAFAGQKNTTSANAFFGASAGQSHTTGNHNSYFGAYAGSSSVTGSRNSLFGSEASMSNGLTNATAIGARARVDQSDSLVLGSIEGVNGAFSSTNVGIGTTQPTARLHVEDGPVFVSSDADGTVRIGERHRDNSVVAWGVVAATGGITQSFGVSAVTKDATGVYTVTIAAATSSAANLVPVAVAVVSAPPTSSAAARLVTVHQVSTTQFKVYITNGAFAAVDNGFTFIVTGR